MRLLMFRSREDCVMMTRATRATRAYKDGELGGNPKSVPPVVVVHPRLAKLAGPVRSARHAALAVSK